MNGANFSFSKEALISFVAGVTASYITLPIWTLRTRITLAKVNKEKSLKDVSLIHLNLEYQVNLFNYKRVNSK